MSRPLIAEAPNASLLGVARQERLLRASVGSSWRVGTTYRDKNNVPRPREQDCAEENGGFVISFGKKDGCLGTSTQRRAGDHQ